MTAIRLMLSAVALVVVTFLPGVGSAVAAEEATDRVRMQPITALPFPDIRAIVQDDQGFIWFGANHRAEGGLIRFDGYQIERFAHDPADETSLSHNAVWTTYIDNEGALWVGTIRGGLNRYNPENENFTRYLHDPGDPTSLPSDDIKAMLQTADGTYWVGTEAGLARFDPETMTARSWFHDPDDPNSLPNSAVRAIAADEETGELWLGTLGGLSIFNPADGTFRNHLHDESDPTSLSDNAVRSILRDSTGAWWVATADGLNRYRPQTGRFTRYLHDPEDRSSIGSPDVLSMVEDSAGRFWIGHGNGLQLFDRHRGVASDAVSPSTYEEVLGSAAVRALLEDDTGAVWVATGTAGAARISPLPGNFDYDRHDPAEPGSIDSDFVARIDMTADGIWVVTDAGVEFFDGTNYTDYTEVFELSGGWPSVHGLLVGDDGSIWLGFSDGRVTRYSTESGPIETYSVPAPADKNRIWPVAQSAAGDVWFRSWSFGVGVIRSTGEVELMVGEAVDDEGSDPAHAYTTDSYFDAEADVLWVTGLGLIRIDLATSELDVFSYNPTNPGSVANQLWGIDPDVDGGLWLASNNGVHKFDPTTEEYVALLHDELPVPESTDVKVDADGRLWIVSGATLTRYDPANGPARAFSVEGESPVRDHLRQNWLASKIQSGPGGRLYAPTLDRGLMSFDPGTFVENPEPPPVVLTGFELSGREVRPGDSDGVLDTTISRVDSLELNHDQNSFTFAFSALNYEHSENNHFRYRLDGFEDDWRLAESERRLATYTNVPAGDYTFRVEASNNAGVWNTEGLAVPITVAAAWYATDLARALAVLALITAGLAVFRWRTAQQRARTRRLERRLVERQRHQEQRETLLAALQEQSDRLNSVMNATPTGVVLLSQDRQVVLANRVAAADLDRLATRSEAGALDRIGELPVDRLLGQDSPEAWATTTFSASDRIRHLSVAARPVVYDEADTDGWVIVWDDITQMHDLQAQSAQQDRFASLGRFAAGIAHDVNNVLTVISLNVELLAAEPTVGEGARQRLDQIGSEAERADRFMTQILDYARRSVSRLEPIDLGVAVGSQLHSLAGVMPPGVSLEFQGGRLIVDEADIMVVEADAIRIEQVVLNLVTNARHAVGASGTITVEIDRVTTVEPTLPSTGPSNGHASGATVLGTVPAGSWVRLSVADDGCGIAADAMPRIFEPFVTYKPVGEGSGLGLAQVLGIAQDHGGHVTVESELGEGSRFSIYFPAVDSSLLQPSADPVPSAPIRRALGETILVVDDDAGIVAALESLLRANGYRVITAASGREAIEQWDGTVADGGTPVELILTDMIMPALDGPGLIGALDARNAEVPVIMMSGMASITDSPLQHELVVGFVRKPIESVVLLHEIALALEAKRSRSTTDSV